jgi:hypothetical protein
LKTSGQKILIEDFTQLKTRRRIFKHLASAKTTIASQPSQLILAVLDATGASFNAEIFRRHERIHPRQYPYVKAAHVVGITGMLEVALSAVSKFLRA